MSKAEEFKRKLEEYEREKAEKSKVFDVREVVRSSREVRTLNDPELGEIRYGVLTVSDLLELSKVRDDAVRGLRMLHLMLKKADPELRFEDVKSLPMDVAARLMNALMEKENFFQAQRPWRSGSRQT